MSRTRRNGRRSTFREHSLSILISGILAVVIFMYSKSDPSTHVGAFFGNAIADWLGVLVFVVATKYFFEIGSGESRRPPRHLHQHVTQFLFKHSLTLVLALTGVGWVVLYARSDVGSKSGQVVGNIVSAWTQVLGLVIITKYARESGSKEGK